MRSLLSRKSVTSAVLRAGRVPEPEKITGEGLLTKHSSFGRLKGIMKAIDEAIRDGNRMMSAEEEDEEIRDGYLKELNETGKN